ncbi:calcium-binding protein, partial [Campylobacter geochelonis]
MENILEKASAKIGETVINSVAVGSAIGVFVAGKGSPQAIAGAFAIYGMIKYSGESAGKQTGKELDEYLKKEFGFDTDKFVNDNLDKLKKAISDINPVDMDYWSDVFNNTMKHFKDTKIQFFSISNPIANEEDGKIVFTISLKQALQEDVKLHIKTMNQTAKGDLDFETVDEIVTIFAGATEFEHTIKVAKDGIYEGEEQFNLYIANIDYNGDDKVLLNYTPGLGTIIDFESDKCPTPTKPNFNLSFSLPSTPTYHGGGGGGSWGGFGGGGGWGYTPAIYIPSTPTIPTKPALANIPYVECPSEPDLNSAMTVKFNNLSTPTTRMSLSNTSTLASYPKTTTANNNTNPTSTQANTTITNEATKIYFDMNGDGFKERMVDWFDSNEGVLVNDINKNGIIDSGKEILGNHYTSMNGSKSIDSFTLLKEFDTNNNGVIDIDDNSNLAIWIDKNKNALTDKDELFYIKDSNSPLSSISITPLDTLLSGYDRNHDFKIDINDSIYNHIYYKENIDNTITLYIYGDDSAKEFLGSNNTTNQTVLTNKGIKQVKEIIFYQTNLDLNNFIQGDNKNNHIIGNNYSNTLQGNGGRDMLDGFDGDDILDGGSGSDKLIAGYGNDTLIGGRDNDYLDGGGWDDRYIFSKGDGVDVIVDSGGIKDTIVFSDKSITKDSLIINSNGIDLNISVKSNTKGYLSNQIIIKNFYNIDNRIELIKFSDNSTLTVNDMISLIPTNKADTIYTTELSQTIDAKDGNDIIYANSGNDTIDGGSGDDTIHARGGNNTIIGNKGNDTLNSGSGNDTYIYTIGDDKDSISDSGGVDALVLNDILESKAKFSKVGNNLIISFDKDNQITINNYFIENNSIESIKFKDKTLSLNNVIDIFITDKDDTLIGTNENDIIDAKGGDDTLNGRDGDDSLYGGAGNDTYIFSKNWGKDIIVENGGIDTIKFIDDIKQDDLLIKREDSNLVISSKDGLNLISVKNLFESNYIYENKTIDFIEFNDGKKLNQKDIIDLINAITDKDDIVYNYEPIDNDINTLGGNDTIYGNIKNDTLNGGVGDDIIYGDMGDDNLDGYDGNDTLNGGSGNDRLNGGYGNDIYVFEKGFGSDEIDDYDGKNIIKFGNGITRKDVVFKRWENNLNITIKNSDDKIEFLNIFNRYDKKIVLERIEFFDGDNIEFKDIKQIVSLPTQGDDIIYADGKIDGLGGDDELHGGENDDVLDGGTGNDKLYGMYENDTYIFGRGYGKDFIDDAYLTRELKSRQQASPPTGIDTIQFLKGIRKDDLLFEKRGDDLLIGIKNADKSIDELDDVLTIHKWYYDDNRIEKFILSDKTEISQSFLLESTNYDDNLSLTEEDDIIHGLDGNDILYGKGGNDVIYGDNGDDTLNGDNGKDILDGGAGNDTLYGGESDDIYLFGRGDGKDSIYENTWGYASNVLEFKTGITPKDLVIMYVKEGYNDNNLIVGLKEGDKLINELSDTITLGYWKYNPDGVIKTFKFSDGTIWGVDEIKKHIVKDTLYTPPLVLDLNSNSTTSNFLESSIAYFDYDGDGVRQKTAWIESGDALLAVDINQDGVINDASELFGTYYKLKDESFAKDGYDALKEFDSDNNGIINEFDKDFNKLLAWSDANTDALTDTTELKTLKELNISSIHLPAKENTHTIENGNIISNESVFSHNDLSKSIKDIWFKFSDLLAKSEVPNEILYDNEFKEISVDSTLYVDKTKILSQAGIKELIIRSGYTGLSTSGVSAKASGNDGLFTLENRWFKSDNLDTIYDSSSTQSLAQGSGVVRDLNDVMSDDKDLQENVQNYQDEAIDKEFDELSIDMDNILNDWVLNDKFNSTNSFAPPIVLDLNANGITSTSLDNSDVYFNYNNSNRRDKTAWIEQDDALLGVDINKDGIINSAYELFGTYSKLANATFAKDGYEALNEFDTNKDGVVDSKDNKFDSLLVWQDANQDGKSQNSEVKTLKELGISSLSLNITTLNLNENGNKISAQSSFTTNDGKTGIVRDVWFEVSDKHSIAVSDLSDEDEKKIAIVEAFRGSRLTEHQRANPYILLSVLQEYDNIKFDTMSKILANRLFGENSKSCQLMYQALNLKLARIVNGEASGNEVALSINLLSTALKRDYNYAIFKLNQNYLTNRTIQALLAKTGVKFSLADSIITGIIGKHNFTQNSSDTLDFSSENSGITVDSRGGNDVVIGSNFHDKINSGNDNDILIGGNGIDILRGGGGNDLLIGGKNSTIYEYYLGDGDDVIYDEGGAKKDIIRFAFLKYENLSVEKLGDDMKIHITSSFNSVDIVGSILIKNGYTTGKIEEYYFDGKVLSFDELLKIVKASTSYKFNKGDGVVNIEDSGGNDILVFGDGVNFKNIIITKSENNLLIALKIDGRSYDELTDKLTIKNFFNQDGRIESFIFNNGVILNHNEILKLLNDIKDDKFIIGDSFNNTLNGTDNANVLNGKGGNDILNGYKGDDSYIFELNSGNDTISDSGGVDKIVFGEGITRDSIQSKLLGDDLVIAFKEDGVEFDSLKDKLVVKNWDKLDNKIEKIMYSDAREFDIATLLNREVKFNKDSMEIILKDSLNFSSKLIAKDLDNDKLNYSIVSNAKHGEFVLSSDGMYSYKANDKFVGEDSILVKVSDGMGSDDFATIKFNIKARKPEIKFSQTTVKEDEILQGSVDILNGYDGLKFEILTQAKNGLFSIEKNGDYEYKPELNFNGDDSVEIRVTNSHSLSQSFKINLSIEAVNDTPKFGDDNTSYELKNTNQINLSLNATDIDNDNLIFILKTDVKNGKISIDESGNLTYISNPNFIGYDSAVISVSDGKASVDKEFKFDVKGYEFSEGSLVIDNDENVNSQIKINDVELDQANFIKNNDNLLISTPKGIVTINGYFTGNKVVNSLKFNSSTIDISNIQTPIKQWWQIKPTATLKEAGIILATGEKENLNGSDKDDTIVTNSNDTVYANSGNDTIISYNNDIVYAGNDDDTLISKANNST